jgi:hypothetical protein
VHGAFAGFTGFSVGLCCNRVVYLPISALVANSPRAMDPSVITPLLNIAHFSDIINF